MVYDRPSETGHSSAVGSNQLIHLTQYGNPEDWEGRLPGAGQPLHAD